MGSGGFLIDLVLLATLEPFGFTQPLTEMSKVKVSGPVTGLEWPRAFQEVKFPRLYDITGWW